MTQPQEPAPPGGTFSVASGPAPAPPRQQEPPGSTAPEREPLQRRVTLRQALAVKSLPREAQDRIAVYVVRGIFFLACAGLGLAGVRVLGGVTGRGDIEPLDGVLWGGGLGLALLGLEVFLSGRPLRTLSAITFGLLVGLALSLVFQFVVELIFSAVTQPAFRGAHGDAMLSFLRLVSTTIFCYYGVVAFLRTKDDFKFIIPFVEFRKEVRRHAPLLLDTSCFIDGRLQGILATGVFDQRLVVPRFVLNELQRVADSTDKSLRERGRRGLDILQAIEQEHHLEVIDHELEPGQQVDDALLILASVLGGKIVSTDFNLEKNARLQGINVININDLAAAVKPQFVPGESLTVKLLREGDDRGQAVGFLRDGTMVVVEGARQKIGQEVAIEVTSALQTNAGKMVFGRLKKPPRAGET